MRKVNQKSSVSQNVKKSRRCKQTACLGHPVCRVGKREGEHTQEEDREGTVYDGFCALC